MPKVTLCRCMRRWTRPYVEWCMLPMKGQTAWGQRGKGLMEDEDCVLVQGFTAPLCLGGKATPCSGGAVLLSR